MAKEKTKGKNKILEENSSTISFYRYMSLGAVFIYMFLCWLLFNNYSNRDQILFILSSVILLSCNKVLTGMARPRYSESGDVLDEGVDLNMEGGLAEHVKDAIILTSATIILASISSYFWLLLILAPLRAFQLLWTSVLSPWIFSSGDQLSEEEKKEMEEKALKKQKKLERRQRRGF